MLQGTCSVASFIFTSSGRASLPLASRAERPARSAWRAEGPMANNAFSVAPAPALAAFFASPFR